MESPPSTPHPHPHNGNAGLARPHPQLPQNHFSRSGSQRPQHQHLISAGHSKRQWGPMRRAAARGAVGRGRVGRRAGRARGGARRAGRAGPGTSPCEEVPAPRFGEVRPRRLRTAACARSPTIRPDLGARGQAAEARAARERGRLVGRGRGGTPVLPPPPPRWIWQPLIPASRRGGAAPPARADRGLLAPASLQNAQENLLPSDLSPAAAVHAPSAARVGPRTTWPLPPPPRLWVADPQAVVTGTGVLEQAPRSPGNFLHPSMPTPPEAEKQQTGPEEADQPPSMSSHDAAPPAPPRRNPCCLCWCCCCSCSWNEERRRAWRASRESRLQPLPSCEVCATPTPTPEEVRSWAQSFDKLMHSPAGRSVFREFLRTEYSEENMLFWLACEELKAEANQHVVDEKARLIYEDYVSILSPKEVSLDSRVREGINKKMQEPSAHTFDDAQLQIYTLMHRDSYPRFLSSPAYRALLLQGASQSSSEA